MSFEAESAENCYDEGLTASMRGDLEGAIKLFEKTIHLDRTMASAYHQLGKCYSRMGKPDLAVELLSQVAKQRPTQTAARLDLGFALLGMGEIASARAEFEAVLRLDPSNGRLFLGRAQAAFLEGDWNTALADAQTALGVGASNFPTLYMLGRSAKLAGNLQLAENTLKKADGILEKSLEIDPDKPEPNFLRGEVAFVQEKFTEALEHYKNAAKHAIADKVYSAYGENFQHIDVLAKKGLCLQRLGQNEQARAVGEDIEGIDPEHKLGKALRES